MEKKNKVITEGWQQKRNSIGIWSIKYQIQYSSMYMSYILWTLRQVKFLNQRINFGNMLRQHLIKIKITNNHYPVLCWQFINWRNKVTYESIQNTITHNIVSLSISSTIGNTSETLGISITSMFTLLTLYHIAKLWWVLLWYLSNHSGFHQYVLQDCHLYWFLWNRISCNKLSISCHWENVLN